jgi:hypothetical protein
VSALFLLSLRSSFSPEGPPGGLFDWAWYPILGRSPVSQTYSGAGSDVDLADRIGGAHGSVRAPLQLASVLPWYLALPQLPRTAEDFVTGFGGSKRRAEQRRRFPPLSSRVFSGFGWFGAADQPVRRIKPLDHAAPKA